MILWTLIASLLVWTGNHWDYAKKDDIINQYNCSNEEQLAKAKEFEQHSHQLFDNPSKPLQDFIGTRYHYDDVYGFIMRRHADDKGYIEVKTFDGHWANRREKVA